VNPRFQADEDLDPKIVSGLRRREPALDFQTAQEANALGLPDPTVLALAAQQGRILVTHDRKTMPLHFADFVERYDCPGVIIVSRKAPAKTVIEELLLIWSASDAEEWRNVIISIPR
jgi:hypothetical protein